MKQIFTTVLVLGLTTFYSAFAQSNLDFESWTGNEPQGWSTSNDLTELSGGAQTTFQETAAPGEGSASVKMVTGSCPDCPTYLADITFGFFDCALPNPHGGTISYGSVMEPGMAYTQRPISVDFMYKSNPMGSDAGGFGIELTRYNSTTGETETVGEALFMAQTQVTDWTQMNVPITYYITDAPDTMNMYATSSIGSIMDCSNSMFIPNMPSPYIDWGLPVPVSGSELYIDAVIINLPSCSGLTLAVTGTKESSLGASDGTATATPSGGTTPYTYEWGTLETTQSISSLIPGIYNVTVTDGNQCQKVGTYNVAMGNCDISVSVSVTNSSTASIYSGDGSAVATVSGGNGPFVFDWNNGVSETHASTSTITNLPIGAYVVLVTEQSNSACAVFGYLSVTKEGAINGVFDAPIAKELSTVQPNPNNGYFSVFSEVPGASITIFNMLGKQVYSSEINSEKSDFNLSDQAKGVYVYQIKDAFGVTKTSKFIIE